MMCDDEIAGVEFISAQYECSSTVDRLVADILGVSPVDENYWSRSFGTLVDPEYEHDQWGRLVIVSARPTLGVLWVVQCEVDIGAHMIIRSNYEVIASDMRELNRAGCAKYTFILYPHDTEINLHALCCEPQVDIIVDSQVQYIRIRPWVPTDDVDICAFVSCY